MSAGCQDLPRCSSAARRQKSPIRADYGTRAFYPRFGGIPNQRSHEWRWPGAGKIKFSHLQLDATVYRWHGAQIALIGFDELTHFTAHQFYYLLSRNRSTRGSRPYIRATCNPDADSWVADFLAWW